MPNDYISRKDAIAAVKHAWAKGLEPSQYIEELPAADVVELQKSKWIELNGGYKRCDQCHKYSSFCTDFCPNCGADMR